MGERGGSDVTGSIVARALKADMYENWTDVSGFLAADPRIVNNAKPINVITYKELRELSYMGASVLHESAIFPVRKGGIPINIKNTNAPEDKGTMIVETTCNMPEYTITGIAGKEITFAHVMGGPAPIIYQKLGLNPHLDYRSSAIGIMNMTPPESAVIASDIAVKSGNVYLGFADRFTGTLIITGEISDVTSALTEVVDYFRDSLGYVVCDITKR